MGNCCDPARRWLQRATGSDRDTRYLRGNRCCVARASVSRFDRAAPDRVPVTLHAAARSAAHGSGREPPRSRRLPSNAGRRRRSVLRVRRGSFDPKARSRAGAPRTQARSAAGERARGDCDCECWLSRAPGSGITCSGASLDRARRRRTRGSHSEARVFGNVNPAVSLPPPPREIEQPASDRE